MEGLVLLLLLLLFAVLVAPFIALAKASSASRESRLLGDRVLQLERAVAALRSEKPAPQPAPAAAEKPETAPEPGLPLEVALAPAPPAMSFEEPPPGPPPLPQADPPPGPRPAKPLAQPLPAARPGGKAFDWEQFMGAKLFAWIGGLALFLGIGFFVKYAFDQDLLPPVVRVALGFAAGLGLVAGGWAMDRKRYRITSHTLLATGILALYGTTFACRSVYEFPFFGWGPTFALMALITAAAFLLAVRWDALVVAVLGLAGGFLTPLLLPAAPDQALGTFGYVALLNGGLLAMALRMRWDFLPALAAGGTILLQWIWHGSHFTGASQGGTALAIYLGLAALMAGGAAWARRWERMNAWLGGAAAALAGSLLLLALSFLDHSALRERPALFLAAVFGAGLCLFAVSLARPGRPHYHAAGGGLGFLLLAAWASSDRTGETLPWILGASLAYAALHSAAPLALARLDPRRQPPRWSHALPLLTFAVILLPVARLEALSFLTWPVLLAVNAIILLAAVLAGAAWLAAGAVVLTFAVLGWWMGSAPPSPDGLAAMLWVIAVFAVLLFAATWLLRGRVAGEGRTLERWEAPFARLAPHLPAFSAGLPFALLVVAVSRAPMADPSPVFGLALLLAALLLGLAWLLRGGALPLVALLACAALQHAWQAQHLGETLAAGGEGGALGWHLGFFLLLAAFPFAFWRRFRDDLLPWVAAALSGPLHFYLVHRLVGAAWPNDYMGLVPALFALPAAAALAVLARVLPLGAEQQPARLAWFGGALLFFITLIIPIQFSREWITVGWALQGAALLWLFRRVPHPGLRATGVALLSVAFIRLAANPAVLGYHPRGQMPLLNWYLYAYGITAACCFAGARLIRRPRHLVLGRNAPPWLYAMCGILLFLLLNLEIADYFTEPGRASLAFEFSSNFGRDMAYTIGWALFALGLLAIGLVKRLSGARVAGLVLLGVALLKLFLHDLANLTNLYRIAALMVTAVIAIVASFLYQKLTAPEPRPSASDEETPPGSAAA